jgi:hypothetical protein
MTEKITMLEGFIMAGSGATSSRDPAVPDVSARLLPFPPRMIRAPQDMALLLTQASPPGARRFAVQMHERACQGADEASTEFWLHVIRRLAAPDNQEDAT